MLLRPWQKTFLFGIGLAAAGLIATNPKFVLPYKYKFIVSQPTVEQPKQPEEITILPDGFTSEEPEQPEDLVADNILSKSSNSAIESRVWIAGSLSIPSLDIVAPLVYVSEKNEKSFQLGLQQGVVQYPGTALPGQLGNMYVFGHSSDYSWAKGSYRTVFAKLPDIKIGSEIKITDGAGRLYTYQVNKTVVVLPTDTQYLSQYNYQKKLLTIQTSYPVGTALKRFLVIAELVEQKD